MNSEQSRLKADKPSAVYVAAWIAAENSLPEDSLRLIKNYDTAHAAWRDAGWPTPMPSELKLAHEAIESDPFAKIAFEIRRNANRLAHEEWKAAGGVS